MNYIKQVQWEIQNKSNKEAVEHLKECLPALKQTKLELQDSNIRFYLNDFECDAEVGYYLIIKELMDRLEDIYTNDN